MRKPCMDCDRVENPEGCEIKECMLWRRWFIHEWDRMRQRYKTVRPSAPQEQKPSGNDPCEGCVCPREMCLVPCRLKRDWESAWKLLQ